MHSTGSHGKEGVATPPQSTESKQSNPEFLFVIGFVLCVVGVFFLLFFKQKSCKVPLSASPLRWMAGGLEASRWPRATLGHVSWQLVQWPRCVTARQPPGGSGICASTLPGSFCTTCEHSRSGPSGNTSCSACGQRRF